jgi:hypothetical protein
MQVVECSCACTDLAAVATESLQAELAKNRIVDKLHEARGEASGVKQINQEAILKDRSELLQESAALKEGVAVATGNKLTLRAQYLLHKGRLDDCLGQCCPRQEDGSEHLDFPGFQAGFRPKARNGVVTKENKICYRWDLTIFDDFKKGMAHFRA